MDEHEPALALREKKDSSILVATELVKRGQADAVVTAGHTGAGMAAAVLKLGRLPGVDRPALAVQLVAEGGTLVLLDIGANPDSSPENLAQYARMGAIFSEHVLGVATPRVALLSIGEEKGKGDLRIQQATELLDLTDLNFIGNVEGKDLTKHQADVVVDRRGRRQRRDQVLRGSLDLHLRPVPDRVRAVAPGPDRLPPDAAGDRPDPRGLRLRAGRRVAAARGRGHRDHHPRPGPAADDRLRRRGRGDDGPDPRPGADRRGAPPDRTGRREPGGPAGDPADATGDAAPTPPAPPAAASPASGSWSPPHERPRADRRSRRRRRDRPARGARDPGRRAGRRAAVPPGGRSSPGRRSSPSCSDQGVRVRVWIVARPGQAMRRARRPGPGPSARPSSASSTSGSSR